MKPTYIMHSVFLTAEERNALASGDAAVETVGISVPAGQDMSGPPREVFVRYFLTSRADQQLQVEETPDGYKVCLGPLKQCRKLACVHNGGSEFLNLRCREVRGDDAVIHQFVFQDTTVLEKSTVCEGIGRYLANPADGAVSPELPK